jgi:hypothetical protein
MNRAKHLQWCKDRALAELDAGSIQNAIASMMSDLRKHKETVDSMHICFMLIPDFVINFLYDRLGRCLDCLWRRRLINNVFCNKCNDDFNRRTGNG